MWHLAWLWLGLHIQICDSLHEDVVAWLLLLHNKLLQTLRVWNNYFILLLDSVGCSDWAEGEGLLKPQWGDAQVQDLPSHVWPAPGRGRTLGWTTSQDTCLWPVKVLGFLPAWQPCSTQSQQSWVEAHAFLLSSLMVTEHHFCCSRQSQLLQFRGRNTELTTQWEAYQACTIKSRWLQGRESMFTVTVENVMCSQNRGS